MAKIVALIVLLAVVGALGSVLKRPKGFGAAKKISGFPNPYIVGGNIVDGRKYPGQISLRVGTSHNCGGSIVNENYILTAAHCSQYEPYELTVLSGTNKLSEGGTVHQVVEIHFHESYNEADSWHNDVSVMKVDPPFVFDDNKVTAPVSLPQQDQVTPTWSNATVIGWGLLSEGGFLPDDLYEVNINIWDHDQCRATYTDLGLDVYPEQICADTTNGGKGSCNGDSGGPLFVDKEVVGLVSWAYGCDEKGYPTVYTRVASYRDWIDSKVNA